MPVSRNHPFDNCKVNKMNSLLLITFLVLLTNFGYSISDTNRVSFERNNLYYLNSKSNNKLIVFLHGGMSNPTFKKKQTSVSLSYLLENNTNFIPIAESNGFDIIVPIKNDSLNWLDNYDYCFSVFKKYINSLETKYEEIYISGFSDGGTGSYKIFYKYYKYFDGLIVFNGYPNHNNYNKKINYSKIKNKKIIFCGTLKDKRIAYEFSLVEYCKQKKYNPNTFFYLTKGKHLFNSYSMGNLKLIFELLTKGENHKTEQIQGLVINDKLITFYKYRKKIIRKYNYGIEIYKENKRQKRALRDNN